MSTRLCLDCGEIHKWPHNDLNIVINHLQQSQSCEEGTDSAYFACLTVWRTVKDFLHLTTKRRVAAEHEGVCTVVQIEQIPPDYCPLFFLENAPPER